MTRASRTVDRRTTLTAAADDLRTLQAGADRRDVSLNTVLREAVEEKVPRHVEAFELVP
jgi:hypothetical protein